MALPRGYDDLDWGRMLQAIMQQESRGDPTARSPAGAVGLLQVMPDTARDPGYGMEPRPEALSDPEANLQFGSEYFARLLDRYDGDVTRALVAYNWGPGNANRWSGRMEDLPAETRDYVGRISDYYRTGNFNPAVEYAMAGGYTTPAADPGFSLFASAQAAEAPPVPQPPAEGPLPPLTPMEAMQDLGLENVRNSALTQNGQVAPPGLLDMLAQQGPLQPRQAAAPAPQATQPPPVGPGASMGRVQPPGGSFSQDMIFNATPMPPLAPPRPPMVDTTDDARAGRTNAAEPMGPTGLLGWLSAQNRKWHQNPRNVAKMSETDKFIARQNGWLP